MTSVLPILLVVAVARPALADTEHSYQTIAYIETTDAGNVNFKLNDDTFWRCSDVDLECLPLLLTALSTNREVKPAYNTGDGSGSTPYVVTRVRVR